METVLIVIINLQLFVNHIYIHNKVSTQVLNVHSNTKGHSSLITVKTSLKKNLSIKHLSHRLLLPNLEIFIDIIIILSTKKNLMCLWHLHHRQQTCRHCIMFMVGTLARFLLMPMRICLDQCLRTLVWRMTLLVDPLLITLLLRSFSLLISPKVYTINLIYVYNIICFLGYTNNIALTQ